MRLSDSKIQKYTNCPRAYYYQYVRKVVTPKKVDLAFGNAVHAGIEAFFLSGSAKNAVTAFREAFTPGEGEDWADRAKKDPAQRQTLGELMLEMFPAEWEQTGLEPVRQKADGAPLGEPMVEIKLEDPERNMIGIPDLLAQPKNDKAGEVIPVDFKTPASFSSPDYLRQMPQAAMYQDLIERQLGLPVRDNAVFEMKKSNAGQANLTTDKVKMDLQYTGRRSDQAIAEVQATADWVRLNVEYGFFPKTPRAAYNSPCTMCDFASLCEAESGVSQPQVEEGEGTESQPVPA